MAICFNSAIRPSRKGPETGRQASSFTKATGKQEVKNRRATTRLNDVSRAGHKNLWGFPGRVVSSFYEGVRRMTRSNEHFWVAKTATFCYYEA